MRVAQLPPLYESLPPPRYGGTERVVSYLVEELVHRGHEVTIFGTGDSTTSAKLVPVCERALSFDRPTVDPCAFHFLQLGLAYAQAANFDVIHAHTDFRAMAFAPFVVTPTISTNHNCVDSPEATAILRAYPDALLTTLSESQRAHLTGGRWLGTVYNGIPVEQFPFSPEPGEYLVYLGRMSPEKGPDDAIRVALLTGIPLRMAAKVNQHERDYFDQVLRPLMRGAAHVEYLGEVTDGEKKQLLAGALALLAPVRWPEPFGLAPVEAMACGTPVIARPVGALPETIVDCVTGFYGTTPEQMATACTKVHQLSRKACRKHVERKFSVQSMVDGYESIYRQVVGSKQPPIAA